MKHVHNLASKDSLLRKVIEANTKQSASYSILKEKYDELELEAIETPLMDKYSSLIDDLMFDRFDDEFENDDNAYDRLLDDIREYPLIMLGRLGSVLSDNFYFEDYIDALAVYLKLDDVNIYNCNELFFDGFQMYSTKVYRKKLKL